MDNSDEVDKAGQKIERNYQNREDFQVDVKLFDDKTNPDDAENYCGIIFIVGKECFDRLREIQSVMDKYSKQLVLPIAYIRVGDNHYHISKYYRISESYLDKNCANHLIMRSYRRSAHCALRTSRFLGSIVRGTRFIDGILVYGKKICHSM